ncbi:hypothetical protein BDF20DRAFT_371492 [Mycotypha africana]|uniref:uncharacterized protein n=1 Tax=Mycotypha africana TaxID=64632 RepID=UPI0022FFF3FE|nr:uncharacterized protein BDF20DRAFT_371492 [Mycotypha africana]KAI8984205.1 hypothetical protein BDF20DRAFT_371492 [Mycotypha africana]
MATAITTAISNDKDVASEEEQAKNQVKPTSSPPSLPTETPKDVTENDHTVPVSTMAATSLSSDQKRANHIASEQKRRNIIRGGFKDLTELIPTLKDINNSKSTILFKSVDYIKHLEKRNKSLKERLSLLQAKVQQKHRLQRQQQKMQQRQQHHYPLHHAPHSDLSTNATIAALLLHRNQQRQLEMLQEQLKRQQELLAKHNIPTTTTTTTTTTPTPTPTTTAIITPVNKTTFSRHHQQPSFHSLNHNVSYNSISIPVLNDTPTTSTTTSPILLNASLPSCSNSFVNSHTTSSISSTTTTAALVIPASFEDYQQLQPQYSQHSSNNNFITPSFTIPADENFHYHQQQQNVYRERLLSSGKLNHLREDFDYIM